MMYFSRTPRPRAVNTELLEIGSSSAPFSFKRLVNSLAGIVEMLQAYWKECEQSQQGQAFKPKEVPNRCRKKIPEQLSCGSPLLYARLIFSAGVHFSYNNILMTLQCRESPPPLGTEAKGVHTCILTVPRSRSRNRRM